MKIFFSILLILLTTGRLYSQVEFNIRDKDTKEPVVGVQVKLRSLVDDTQEVLVSDIDGKFESAVKLPLVYEISHIAYEALSDTARGNKVNILLSPGTIALDEMIITGQFRPQSIDEAVHTVKVIDRKRIEAQGAVDLADVLSNNLNITLTPSKSSGRTTISMLGLDGAYVKILIDGLPFPSVDGNGNNVDITQINLNNVERIEIVEGPMAVNYGANALAGVINIITKNSVSRMSNRVSIQEETVGGEYGFNRGRHIQSISLGHQFKNNFYLMGDLQRNDFKGFLNGFEGENYTGTDNRRGYDWQPKLQYSTSATIGYQGNKLRAKYRFSYFWQSLDIFSRTVDPDEHPSSGILAPFSLDNKVSTRRFTHNLNLTGRLGRVNYNIASVYSGVKMNDRIVRYRILTETEEETITQNESFLNALTSRGNFTNFFNSDKFNLELGYEYTYESLESASVDSGKRDQNNFAGFASIEWSPLRNFTFRPGIRSFYNSQFSSPLIYSFNVKYEAPFDFDIRASFGRSYRTPNLTELYFYFVDANHDVRGNADLTPEDGYGISLDIKKTSHLNKVNISNSFKIFYNSLSDQIALSVVNNVPLRFQYINIDRFRSKGLLFSNQLIWKQLTINAGISYIGRYNQLVENEETSSLDKFLFSPEINFNATYSLIKPNLRFAVFYKHTGRVEQFVLDTDTDEFVKGKTNAFNWLDFSTTWKTTKYIELQGGVKNILDISDIQTTSGQAGTHSAAPTSVGLTYGRSYFLRASYIF